MAARGRRRRGSTDPGARRLGAHDARSLYAALFRHAELAARLRRLADERDRDIDLHIPFAPFQSVTAIRVYDASDVAQIVAPASYRAPTATASGRIVFTSAPPPPTRRADGIEVDFVVGYGALATATPEPLRRAILTLAAHWRENRGDDADDALPKAVAQLAAPFRRERLQ